MLENNAQFPQPDTAELQVRAQADVAQSLNEWIDTVNNGSVDSLAALYATNAVFLPTFEPRVLTNAAERLKYLTTFKARKNLRATLNESYINILSENAAEASGLYTFTFDSDDGKHQSVKARFIFVFSRQRESDWLIAAHHSSQVPL